MSTTIPSTDGSTAAKIIIGAEVSPLIRGTSVESIKAPIGFERIKTSPPPWKLLSPCSRIQLLVGNLALLWSNHRESSWPKVADMFMKHLKSPPRIHRETQQRKDGYYEHVMFIRWVWDQTEYLWAFTECEDGDDGWLPKPSDITGTPDPSFYDTESYPLISKTKRWSDLPSSPSWETVDSFVEHLKDLQRMEPDGELTDSLVTAITVNVCNTITQMAWKRHIAQLSDAEKVLDVIPPQFWPLFLCWAEQLYTV